MSISHNQVQSLMSENAELKSLLRYLFYFRLRMSDKVEECLFQEDEEKWREIYSILQK